MVCFKGGVRRRGGKGEDPHLGYLFSWLEWPADSQGKSAGLGPWDNRMSEEEKLKGKICVICWRWRQEGRPLQVVCYRTEDKPGCWIWRIRRRGEDVLLANCFSV